MMLRRLLSTVGTAIVLVGWAGVASAQDASPSTRSGPDNPSGTTSSVPGSTAQPPTAGPDAPARGTQKESNEAVEKDGKKGESQPATSGSWSATVRVVDGVTEEPLPNKSVFLKASRPTGPFQRRKPEPVESWESVTNPKGVATFEGLPREIVERGLEIYAIATSPGIRFRSKRTDAADGATLNVAIYPRASNADDIVVERLRTVIEPWEDYVVVTQYWRLRVDGKKAVDTTSLSGEEFEHGLPLQLPLDAQGIHLFGPGKSKIIDSTAYWKGTLRPNDPVQLRTRFSMSASSPKLVYRQTVEYPVENAEVVVPLQTDYPKVPRLHDATLAAEGFESIDATTNVPGFRKDNEYLYATGKKLNAGETFAAQITGLPFERPVAPWVALGLGLFGIGLILVFARRETGRLETSHGVEEAISALEEERAQLLDELAELERAHENDDISEITYETESLHLRERLSLIMKKLEELRAS